MRRWIILLVVIALIGAGTFATLQLSNARTFQIFGDLVARIETDAPVVALTFDDGPTPDYTEPVLEILRAHGVRATFFLTGRETAENPLLAIAIANAGHQIGNHSWSHSRMIFVSPAVIATEIERTDAAIRDTGYQGKLLGSPVKGR